MLIGGPRVSHGSALIGTCQSPARAFQYTEDSGFVDLGTVGGFASYFPWSVSQDGGVVFGEARVEPGEPLATFRYVAGNGMIALPRLEGQVSSVPTPGKDGIARDGSVVVGTWTDSEGGYHSYLWDEASGARELPAPYGFVEPSAIAVHPDGEFVAGHARLEAERTIGEAVLWQLDGTPRILSEQLSAAGIDLGETSLVAATSFTPIGDIAGPAQRGQGYYLHFIAQVP